MGLKRILRTIEPNSVDQGLKLRRDQHSRAAVERRRCDTSHLRLRITVDLARLLSVDAWEWTWRERARRFDAMGIFESADGVNPVDRRSMACPIREPRPAAVLEVGTNRMS